MNTAHFDKALKANGNTPEPNYNTALSSLTVLFFMMGFITCLNDSLIPLFKKAFNLSYTGSMLVQFFFFGAYFMNAIPSSYLVEKLGYKRGMIIGFLVAAVGCLSFYPASLYKSYPLFLSALFVLASGITLLQVAGNPYVAILGRPETASARLTLVQAFNSLATTVAPIFGSYTILSMMIVAPEGQELTATQINQNLQAVQLPYIGLALSFCVIALLLTRLKMPNIRAKNLDTTSDDPQSKDSIWKYSHLIAGIIAIFCYVGGEVAIGSFITNYIKHSVGLAEAQASQYLSFYWGGAMLGRFVATPILQRVKPANALLCSALAASFLILAAILTTGWLSISCLLAVGLFNSLMFPTIFTLSVTGLGKYTNQASGLLSTAIFGGAVIPLLQGQLADTIGIQIAFSLSLVCYLYITWFAWKGYK